MCIDRLSTESIEEWLFPDRFIPYKPVNMEIVLKHLPGDFVSTSNVPVLQYKQLNGTIRLAYPTAGHSGPKRLRRRT